MITINIAEADDAEREKRRLQMHEPYRTLLGHFRHEIGHYYWDRLIEGPRGSRVSAASSATSGRTTARRSKRHHQQGPPADWANSFVSAYASAHPWEDWAETWAHYLHMTDTLETAVGCGLSLRPETADEPGVKPDIDGRRAQRPMRSSDDRALVPLTYVLNNLNRGMGLPDGYPFVLSPPAIEKLRFVHEVIRGLQGLTSHRLNGEKIGAREVQTGRLACRSI